MPKINPTQVRIMMLKKGIKPRHLMNRYHVGRAAISLALSGERKALLEKIYRYVKAA